MANIKQLTGLTYAAANPAAWDESKGIKAVAVDATNPAFLRLFRLSAAGVSISRPGFQVGIPMSEMLSRAVAAEPNLTWPPRFTTQPAAASTAFAKATLTSDNVNIVDGKTVTLGNKTYTFKTALTPTEGEILIGADADGSCLNLARAINHTGTPDVDYKAAAAHTQIKASEIVDIVDATHHNWLLTSLTVGTASNAYATTTIAAHLSFGGATFGGGTAAAAFTVVVQSELSVTYAWKESADGVTYGAALSNGGIYSGATSTTLTITPTDLSKNGYYYKSEASNARGTTASKQARLTVT